MHRTDSRISLPQTNSCHRELGCKSALPWFANGGATLYHSPKEDDCYLDNFSVHVLFCPVLHTLSSLFPCLFFYKHTDEPYTFGPFRSKSCTYAPVQIHHGERCQGCGGHHQRQVARAACQGQGYSGDLFFFFFFRKFFYVFS